mgnify:CR=1 FL=1
MNPLQAAFFLNKTAYAEADVVPHDTQVAGGETSRTMPDAPAYTPPPLPGGPLHPLYQRLALAKDHLDNEWRNWVASRGPDNPYGFMGYIAQHSPEARARAAKKALLMQQPPQKMAAMSEHALRREDGNGKFRKHKPGDERPASEEIAMTAKVAASDFYGVKEAGIFDSLSHALHGTPHIPMQMPLKNVRPHAPLLEHSGSAMNNASTKIMNAPGKPSPSHLAVHDDIHPWAKVVQDVAKEPGSIVDNAYNKLRGMGVQLEYPDSMNHLFQQLEGLGVPGNHLTAPIDASQYKVGAEKVALGLKDMLKMQHYADMPIPKAPHGVPPQIASIPAVAQQWLAKQEFSAPRAIMPQAMKIANPVAIGGLAGAIGGGIGGAWAGSDYDERGSHTGAALGALGGALTGGVGGALGGHLFNRPHSVPTTSLTSHLKDMPKPVAPVTQSPTVMPKSDEALTKLKGVMQEGDKLFDRSTQTAAKLDQNITNPITQSITHPGSSPNHFDSRFEMLEHFGYGLEEPTAAAHLPHRDALSRVWGMPEVPKTKTDIEQAAHYLREMRHPANGAEAISQLKAARGNMDPSWMQALIAHAERLGPYARPRPVV